MQQFAFIPKDLLEEGVSCALPFGSHTRLQGCRVEEGALDTALNAHLCGPIAIMHWACCRHEKL